MRRLSWSFTSAQLGPHPFRDRVPPDPEPPVPGVRADVRESQERRTSPVSPRPGAARFTGGMPPELDQPGLTGVQFQPELREPAAQLVPEPLGVFPVLEPDDEVVGEPHDDHITARVALPPPARPTGPGRSAGTRWRAAAKPMPPAVIPCQLSAQFPSSMTPAASHLPISRRTLFIRDPVPEEPPQPVPIKLAEGSRALLRASMTSPQRSGRGRRAGCPPRRPLSC